MNFANLPRPAVLRASCAGRWVAIWAKVALDASRPAFERRDALLVVERWARTAAAESRSACVAAAWDAFLAA